MQIFAYLKNAEINDTDLDAVRAAGILPVAVDSFDDIKVIEILPGGEQTVMLRAALKAINDGTGSVSERFGKNMIRAYTET